MCQYQIDYQDDRQYPMGMTVLEQGLHVSVTAAGDSCSLVLYKAKSSEPCARLLFPNELRQGDVWSMTVVGTDLHELEYGFEVDGMWRPDPYGRMFKGRESWGGLSQADAKLRSPVAVRDFDWEGDKPLCLPYEASIIYRLHIRGFTRHPSAKLADGGTFKAILDKIPYLKELGITTVEVMPVAEFQELQMTPGNPGNPLRQSKPTGKLIYWGYAKAFQFAPKASYSANAGQDPVTEFKELVKGLHRASLELVIELYFTGTENPYLVLDVVRFWVQEYHVDGIHLVGEGPWQLLAQDPFLAHTKLWASKWDSGPGGNIRHLGIYNDGFMIDMRRLLKGDEGMINALIFRTRRNPAGCGMINYIANTNGFTLADMVSYDIKHNEANGENNQDGNDYNYSWNCGVEGPVRKKKVIQLRRKQIRNALLLVFLSQGTPLLLSGDEFGNSQTGNNNSYCQDNPISWLDWNHTQTGRESFAFVKTLIRFRRSHPVLSGASEPRNMDYLVCGFPDVSYHGVKTWVPEFENFRRQLGILYCGDYGKRADETSDDYLYVIYNLHWEPHEFALPNLPKDRRWYLAADTDTSDVNGFYPAGSEPLLGDQKRLMVSSRTIMVLIGY